MVHRHEAGARRGQRLDALSRFSKQLKPWPHRYSVGPAAWKTSAAGVICGDGLVVCGAGWRLNVFNTA